MASIRKGDMVEVISGNDRGKRGRVLRVIPKRRRLVVQGVNLRWKHMRRSQQAPQGGRLRREMPIHASNVMLFDEASGRKTRIGFQTTEGGVRVARATGSEVGTAVKTKEAGEAKAEKPKKKAAKKTARKATKKAPAKKKAKGAE